MMCSKLLCKREVNNAACVLKSGRQAAKEKSALKFMKG